MAEYEEIFVLDMEESVKTVALAADMIRLFGLQVESNKIEFEGLIPGEKLYEELLVDDEQSQVTLHQKLRIALVRLGNKVWLSDPCCGLPGRSILLLYKNLVQ